MLVTNRVWRDRIPIKSLLTVDHTDTSLRSTTSTSLDSKLVNKYRLEMHSAIFIQ